MIDTYYIPYTVNVVVLNENWDTSGIGSIFEDWDGSYDGPLWVTDKDLLPNLLVKLGIYPSTSKAIQAGRKGKIPSGFDEIKANKSGVRLYTYNPMSPIEDVVYIIDNWFKRAFRYFKSRYKKQLSKFELDRKGLRCEQFTPDQIYHLRSVIEEIFKELENSNKELILYQLNQLLFTNLEMENGRGNTENKNNYLTKKQRKFLKNKLHIWSSLYPSSMSKDITSIFDESIYKKLSQAIFNFNNNVIFLNGSGWQTNNVYL